MYAFPFRFKTQHFQTESKYNNVKQGLPKQLFDPETKNSLLIYLISTVARLTQHPLRVPEI